MKLTLFSTIILFLCSLSFSQAVWINEIEYDNRGADTLEYVEIAGRTGTDLSVYTLAFVNGSNNSIYDEFALFGTLEGDDSMAVKVFYMASISIQNGPDGLALIKNETEVIEFISYEGVMTDVQLIPGSGAFYTSTDVLVSETSTNDKSLQLTGSNVLPPFTWVAAAASPGIFNVGQRDVLVTSIESNVAQTTYSLDGQKILFNVEVEANLFDISGRQIFSGLCQEISISKSGVYILNFKSNSGVQRVKLMID